jgi:hypothetical protein
VCGYGNHSAIDCKRKNEDPSLINLDPSISFAESARGKLLISKGYNPFFIKYKDPTPRSQNDTNGQKRKSTCCNLSSNDDNLPLIDVYVTTQLSKGGQDISCLLDTGADICYIDVDLIN